MIGVRADGDDIVLWVSDSWGNRLTQRMQRAEAVKLGFDLLHYYFHGDTNPEAKQPEPPAPVGERFALLETDELKGV